MFNNKREQPSTEKAKPEYKEKEVELDEEDRERLAEFGISQIEDSPSFAWICLKLAGRSKEEIRPLLELSKILEKNTKWKKEKTNKEIDQKVKEMYKSIANAPKEKLNKLAKNILKTLEKKE